MRQQIILEAADLARLAQGDALELMVGTHTLSLITDAVRARRVAVPVERRPASPEPASPAQRQTTLMQRLGSRPPLSKGRQRRRIPAVFKTKALAAVRDGYTMAEVGRALGLHDSVVRKWVLRNGGAPARDQSTQLQTIRNTINIQPDEMHKGGSGRRIYAPALRQRILDFMQREHTPGATMERALGLSRGMLTRWMFEQRTGKPYDKRKRTTRAKKS